MSYLSSFLVHYDTAAGFQETALSPESVLQNTYSVISDTCKPGQAEIGTLHNLCVFVWFPPSSGDRSSHWPAVTMVSRFFWKTPLYQNTGSTARDHLASERTFLAWIRTGLGFLALGIAIERFAQLDLRQLLKPLRDQQRVGQQDQAPKEPDQADIEHELEKEQSQVLVGTLMALGSGSIVYGTSRYFSNLKLLEKGFFKPAYHGSAFLAASVAGLAGGVYGTSLRRKWEVRRQERQDMRDSR